MAVLGNSGAFYQSRRYLASGDVQISDRAYNGILGGTLLWGFLLNYGMVALFGTRIVYAVAGMSPWIFLIAYLALVFAGSVLITKHNPVLGFIGFNMIAVPLGVCVCTAVEGIPIDIVSTAVLMTAVVTLVMMIAGTLFPAVFLRMHRVLFLSLGTVTLGYLITTLFFGNNFVFEWIFTGIFSLYIAFDWARANACARTVDNAISCAAMLYVDIVNLFLRILRILARNRKRN